jgi:hypothetical protein
MVLEYEVLRERVVISPLRELFILFLGHNRLVYGSRWFLIYLLLYYCIVHAYFPDEYTV